VYLLKECAKIVFTLQLKKNSVMTAKQKEGRYQRIINQLNELLPKTNHLPSKMATINALLYHKMKDFFWVGFYIYTDGKLLVGPYQGPLACQELENSKGVCWASFNSENSIIVDDVETFPGHIACDSRSKSEIAIPVYLNNKIHAVLDVDSNVYSNFDSVDQEYLEKIVKMLAN
jgi:L-methionine (R)-S-oxide reductase